MKLIKTSTSGRETDRCKAITSSTGKRCSRSAKKNGLCKQHFEINRKIRRKLSSYPGGLLDEIPRTPESLEGEAADRWNQYCEVLKSYNELRGAYLIDILFLILAEEMRSDALHDIERQGMYNEYTSESGSGSNINGPMVALQRLDKIIQDKRKTYWLIPDASRTKQLMSDPGKKKQTDMKSVKSSKNF